MSVLLEKIRDINTKAADGVIKAGFKSDSEIRSLTREDLQELFPGQEKMKMRKRIYETISKTDSVDELLKKLQDFIPHDKLKAALSDNGVLVDYLHMLTDMKTKLDNVQNFLEDNITFLEASRDAQSRQELASASTSNAATHQSEKNTNSSRTESPPQDSNMEIDGDKDAGSPPSSRKRHASTSNAATHQSEKNTSNSSTDTSQGEIMSGLLNRIRSTFHQPADEIEKAGFRSDSEVRSLTQEDLRELFPGTKMMKMRKSIFETINKTDSVAELLNDLQALIPHDNLKTALSNNGVLVKYLNILKDMHTQQNKVQKFLEANIKFLVERRDASPTQKPASASTSDVLAKRSDKNTKVLATQTSRESPRMTGAHDKSCSNLLGSSSSRSSSHSQKPSQKPPVTVRYRMVVSGKTFNADQQILNQIKSSAPELNLIDVEATGCVDDSQITLVFCPIVSRVGTDVEAAMKKVPDDKPVILVLMHHAHEVKHVASMKTWTDNHNIVLHVNVFYHEKVPGLIICPNNEDAITAVKNEILKYGIMNVHRGSVSASQSRYDTGAVNNSVSQIDNQNSVPFWKRPFVNYS